MKKTNLCSCCKIPKTKENTSVNKNRGFHAYCKLCDKARASKYYYANKHTQRSKNTYRKGRLKYTYNITPEEYEKMFIQQKGCCAICINPCEQNKHLYIDHCHVTGKIRGLLCNNCNLGIGNLKHDISILQNAIKYLT